MSYTTGCHTVFHHRYHIVWVPKYRYKVLEGKIRERVRDIAKQVCDEMGVKIVSGVLSRDHVHMFVEIPPHIAVSQFAPRWHKYSVLRAEHLVKCNRNFLSSKSDIGGESSGLEGTSVQQVEILQMRSY